MSEVLNALRAEIELQAAAGLINGSAYMVVINQIEMEIERE